MNSTYFNQTQFALNTHDLSSFQHYFPLCEWHHQSLLLIDSLCRHSSSLSTERVPYGSFSWMMQNIPEDHLQIMKTMDWFGSSFEQYFYHVACESGSSHGLRFLFTAPWILGSESWRSIDVHDRDAYGWRMIFQHGHQECAHYLLHDRWLQCMRTLGVVYGLSPSDIIDFHLLDESVKVQQWPLLIELIENPALFSLLGSWKNTAYSHLSPEVKNALDRMEALSQKDLLSQTLQNPSVPPLSSESMVKRL